MLDGQDVSNPVLQILALKNIQNNMDGMTRYKVTLYDGDSQHNCKILFNIACALIFLCSIKYLINKT